jgi:hypothetical protein
MWRLPPDSASVSWEDRLVHLRIAVDALVGSDKTKMAIQWLNDLFSSVGEDSRGDMLWATGQGYFERTWGNPPRTDVVSAFDHWFWSFADTQTTSSTAAEPAPWSTSRRTRRTLACSSTWLIVS